MSWSDRYLGWPEADCHCWGLVVRVFRAELGIELPEYDGAVLSAAERAEVDALVRGEEATGLWRPVPPSGTVRPFDVLVFRCGGFQSHVGIAISGKHMLHMQSQARVELYDSGRWATRLTGAFRHVQTPLKGAL